MWNELLISIEQFVREDEQQRYASKDEPCTDFHAEVEDKLAVEDVL
jgi:hypothetical protein